MSKATMDLNSIEKALNGMSGVDFSGRSLKLDSANDAQPIVEAIDACSNLNQLTLTGNTLGVAAARAIGQALRKHPELTVASWADIFTGRLTNEIPLALDALSEGLIAAGARLTCLDLSDNAFGPCGVEALVKLLQSDVCSQLQELRLNNNGMGIGGAKILAAALEGTPRALRVFVGGRNRLENDGATALAAQFQKMGTLEEIAIPQNGIYHAGVRALSEAFKLNPGLSAINLNDNTVGPKGAAALAAVIPRLSQLRSLNCGDCLLRSKGAVELANTLREHTQLEIVDLSHNEIGREACLAVADAISARPAGAAPLRQVVLAGNSLGGATSKQAMRDKLGDCAQLSGDEDVSGSESEEETDSDDGGGSSQDTEDSAPEDAQHVDTAQPVGAVVDLDRSGTEEIMSEAARFIKEPTLDNFMRLGANAADVLEAHVKSLAELDSDTELERTIEALLCVCGLSGASEAADRAARRLCRAACERAGAALATWPLANTLLKGLGLIKSENKDYKIRWLLPSCYAVLAREMREPYFPAGVRDTLQFFIASKRATLAPETRAALERHEALFV